MAAPKTGWVKEGCSKLFKTFDIALKKSERSLVLSTTYGLNSSWSKKVTIGLRLRIDGSFEPVVKFLNNYSSGVSLNVEAWEGLSDRFEEIEKYFEKGERAPGSLSCLLNDTVTLSGGCAMRFTSAHGSKVIAFYTSNPEDAVVAESQQVNEEEDEDTAEPKFKKRKNYSPVIVMQKITFDGLRHIACCVDEHLMQLGELVGDVNKCKELLVQHFASVVKARKIKTPTLQQIGVVVCEEADAARQAVKGQLGADFNQRYLDIVFYELTRLFLSYIIADICQTVLIDK